MKEHYNNKHGENQTTKEKFGLFLLPLLFKISYVLTFLGLVLKITGFAFGTQSLILGMGAFAICNFININFVKNTWEKGISVSISVLTVGTLFKIMMWPGAAILSTISLPAAMGFIILYQFTETEKSIETISRASILIVFVIILHSLSPKTFFTTFVKRDEIGAYLYEKMKNNPENETDKKAFNNYWYKRGKSQIQGVPIVTDSVDAKQ